MWLPKHIIFAVLMLFGGKLVSQTLSISAPTIICSGDAFTANASFSGAGTVTFQYSVSAGLSILSQLNSQAQITSYGCGAATYTCNALNGSNQIVASATASIVRNCGSLSISVSQNTLCGPGTVLVTGAGTPSFTWNTGATTNSISMALTQGTLITLNSNASACAATASITVHNLSTYQSHSVVCPGTSCTLTAAAAPVYNWFQPPGTLVNNGTSAQVVVSPTVLPQTYTVYAFFPGNCILNKTLTLLPLNYLPRSNATASVCPSVLFNLTALGANSYTWSTGSQTLVNNPITSSLTAAAVYTLSADSAGCSGTKQVSIGIYTVPVLQVNAQYTTICNGQSTSIFASGAASYTWTYAPGLMTNPFSNSVIVQPFTSTVYSVTGVSAQGCSTSSNISILFGTFPAVSIFSTASAVCPGFQSSITASGANQCIWSGTSFTGQIISPTITLPPGSYTLLGSNGGSCLDSLSFTIGSLPPLQIIASASSDFTCLDESGNPWPVKLSANGVMSFSWAPFNPAQMTQSIGAITVVSPTTTACYTLTGFTNTCAGKKVMCVDFRGVCTGLSAQNNSNTISIYPTLVGDVLIIEGISTKIENLILSDCWGRMVNNTQLKEQAQSGRLDVRDLAAGTYFLILSTANQNLRKTFIKQ